MANSWLAIIMIFTLWLGDKTKNRCLAALLPCAISIIGSSLVWKLPAHLRVGRLIGFYLWVLALHREGYVLTPGLSPLSSPCLSSSASSRPTSLGGRRRPSSARHSSWRVCVSLELGLRRGETDAADCVGNLIGPQTFRAKDAPTYAPALATIVACNAAVLVIMVVIRVVYARRNARVDETAQPEEDMTDR